MSTNRVSQLEHELARARADAQAQHLGALVKKLEAIRSELLTARQTYAELAQRIKKERLLRAQIQANINEIVAAISISLESRPAVFTYIPHDSECVEWQKQHRALERERDKLLARRDAVPLTQPMDAIIFEGELGIIANLERAEANTLSELSGIGPGKLEPGGVFAVS